MVVVSKKKPTGSAKKTKSANGKSRRFSGKVFIVPELCKGCGFCVEFCPTDVLALEETFNMKGYHPPVVVDLDACNGCDMCGLYCPDFAIHGVRKRVKESNNEG